MPSAYSFRHFRPCELQGIQTLSNGFSQYSELSQKATLSGNIQVHFLQMRLASERYLESLDEQYETNYQSSKLAIDELLNNLIQTTTKTDSLASLQLVQDSVAAFDTAYGSMKQSQLLIDQLVNIEMVKRETNALKAAQSLLYESYNNNDPNASLYAGMLMENFLAAKITVLSYSNNNDLKPMKRVKISLNTRCRVLKVILNLLNHPLTKASWLKTSLTSAKRMQKALSKFISRWLKTLKELQRLPRLVTAWLSQ